MRILVDVAPDQLTVLAEMAAKRKLSRAEVIRQALEAYVVANRAPLASYFGLWAGNPEVEDADEYVARLREEWDR